MANIITNIGAGLMKFTFTDMDGDVFAYFRMNPADIKLYERLNTIDAKIEELQKHFEGCEEDTAKVIELNNAVEELFCYVIGYDVKECLFGFVSAMSIMENGQCFWEKVMEVLQREVGKEVEKRGKKMQNNIRKYTDKYKT